MTKDDGLHHAWRPCSNKNRPHGMGSRMETRYPTSWYPPRVHQELWIQEPGEETQEVYEHMEEDE